jgi:hypothetical protein
MNNDDDARRENTEFDKHDFGGRTSPLTRPMRSPTRALGAEVPPRAASTSAELDRLCGIRPVIAVAESEQQISAFDVDTTIAAARSRLQSTRRRRVVSHHRWDQTDILRPIEERAEGFRIASVRAVCPRAAPVIRRGPRRSVDATDHGRGTRAPGSSRDTRCRLDRRTHQRAASST